MYILMNQSGLFLQRDGSRGARATAARFARYVDAFNAAAPGWRVIEAA